MPISFSGSQITYGDGTVQVSSAKIVNVDRKTYNTRTAWAEYATTTGAYNTFVGDRAGVSATTASYCTAFGTETLRSNTTEGYHEFSENLVCKPLSEIQALKGVA